MLASRAFFPSGATPFSLVSPLSFSAVSVARLHCREAARFVAASTELREDTA
jgi:hypothetical protein